MPVLEDTEQEKKAKFFIEELIVYKVDLVRKPATGDKFLVVRGEDQEIINSALTDEEAISIRESLLSSGDINVVRLGRSKSSEDQNIETNRESIEEENEMANESKLVPKTEAPVEDLSREETDKENKEEVTQEPETKEEVVREENTEEEVKGKEPTTTVQVDMSRSEELLSNIVGNFDKLSKAINKRNEEADKTVKDLSDKLDKFNDKIEELERSMGVSNEHPSPEDETTTEKVEREEEKPFWSGVL